MSANNSCGDPPMWKQMQIKELNETGPYERTAIDHDKVEIDRLRHEILRLKVHIQNGELEELHQKHFREMHPAVQDAWNQYQEVLRLTSNE